jgi:Anti-sigma-K factor rskA
MAEPTEHIQLSDPVRSAGDYNNIPFDSLQTIRAPQQYPSDADLATQMATHNVAQAGWASQTPLPPSPTPTPAPATLLPLPPARRNRLSTVFIAAVLLLLIIAVSAGAFALFKNKGTAGTGQSTTASQPGTNNTKPVVANTIATAFFSDSGHVIGKSDMVTITASGLGTPPSGSQYDAWLLNVANEQTFSLGQLSLQGQSFTVKGSINGQNLLGQGNKLEVTQEQGNVSAPTGKVLLTATFPPQAFVHIRHLLFSFPNTPGHIGLLVGLRQQAQLLNAQALQLNNPNAQVTQCIAQNMLDIIEGSNGQHAQPLSQICIDNNVSQAGDGYGLLGSDGYIQMAATHASLASNQSDSTETIKIHAGHVQICLTNIKDWTTAMDQDLQVIVNNPHQPHKIQDVITLADHTYNGVDINNDESVDPVTGEGAAITAYNHGQLMAQLRLNPGS